MLVQITLRLLFRQKLKNRLVLFRTPETFAPPFHVHAWDTGRYPLVQQTAPSPPVSIPPMTGVVRAAFDMVMAPVGRRLGRCNAAPRATGGERGQTDQPHL